MIAITRTQITHGNGQESYTAQVGDVHDFPDATPEDQQALRYALARGYLSTTPASPEEAERFKNPKPHPLNRKA